MRKWSCAAMPAGQDDCIFNVLGAACWACAPNATASAAAKTIHFEVMPVSCAGSRTDSRLRPAPPQSVFYKTTTPLIYSSDTGVLKTRDCRYLVGITLVRKYAPLAQRCRLISKGSAPLM